LHRPLPIAEVCAEEVLVAACQSKGAAGAAYGGAKRLKMMGMGVRPLLFVLSPIVVVEINAELTFLLKN